MPQPTKISDPRPLKLKDLARTGPDSYKPKDRLKTRRDRLIKRAKLIPNLPHRGSFIPYLMRSLLDYKEKRPLTDIQKKIVLPLAESGANKKLIRRFKSLPEEMVKAFNQEYFTNDKISEVDSLFVSDLTNAAKKIENDLSRNQKYSYKMPLVSGNAEFLLPSTNRTLAGALKNWEKAYPPEPTLPCPPLYQLRLEYRGIRTNVVSDRSDGVEPYLITAVYRIPFQFIEIVQSGIDVFHEMSGPMKIKHFPEDLGAMRSNVFWSPSGGEQDAQCNPLHPIQFHPKILATFYDSIRCIRYTHGIRIQCSTDYLS